MGVRTINASKNKTEDHSAVSEEDPLCILLLLSSQKRQASQLLKIQKATPAPQEWMMPPSKSLYNAVTLLDVSLFFSKFPSLSREHNHDCCRAFR